MGRRERNDRFAKKRDSRTVNLQSNRLADTFSSSICVGKNLSGHLKKTVQKSEFFLPSFKVLVVCTKTCLSLVSTRKMQLFQERRNSKS